MLKACSKCGRVHNSTKNCYGSRLPQTNEQALRNLNKWHKKAKDIQERSFNLCSICYQEGDYTPKALETHHIKKLRDYPNGLLDDSNLVALCSYHHKLADNGDIDPKYLTYLANLRDGIPSHYDNDPPPGG